MKTLIDRRMSLALLSGAALISGNGASAAFAATVQAMPPITIYHLEGRRSERIVWLMEELGLPYELRFTRGDIAASMAAIREISPVVPMAPTVKYGDKVLVESGAIIELILTRHALGKLWPTLFSADYPDHLMWMHFAEGSLASKMFSDYRAWQIQPPTQRSARVDAEALMQFAENFIAKHKWFGGAEFTAADIMMMFPLMVAVSLNIVDGAMFPNVAAWKARIEARPAYRRMLVKARPDGMVSMPIPLPSHPPSFPRAPLRLSNPPKPG